MAMTPPFRAKNHPEMLDSMTSLEIKVRQLAENYNQLRGENAHLKRMCSNKSSEIYRLRGKIEALEQQLEKANAHK